MFTSSGKRRFSFIVVVVALLGLDENNLEAPRNGCIWNDATLFPGFMSMEIEVVAKISVLILAKIWGECVLCRVWGIYGEIFGFSLKGFRCRKIYTARTNIKFAESVKRVKSKRFLWLITFHGSIAFSMFGPCCCRFAHYWINWCKVISTWLQNPQQRGK